jgi:transposase-like protein
MEGKWTSEEVAQLIHARKILKSKGLARDVDIKSICEAAGISRKTAYKWAEKQQVGDEGLQEDLQQQLGELRAEHEELKRRYEELRFENEGRKLAWKLHGVDEFLARKKNTTKGSKKRKR